MRLKILSFVAIAMLFAACSSEEPNPPPEAENIPQVANPYRVSLDDALDNAETLLSQISEAETRSGRRVASVKYFTTPSTRSADSDTMLYLINYENDGGFALLSADSRLRPVYAISDEGSLNLEDTVYNKGLAMFARGVEAEIASVIAPPVIDTTYNPVIPTPVVKTIYQQVEPLLSASQRRWGQRGSYNQYCPEENNSKTPAGCAAIATGQMMSYYQWPQSYGGETFPWVAMNAGHNDERIAKFLRLLGNSENLDINYALAGSVGDIVNNIRRTAINMGYEDPGEMVDFSTFSVSRILLIGYDAQSGSEPVLCCGFPDEGVGHAWIIDGMLQYQYVGNALVDYQQILPIMFHCVWGWYGGSNGYFYWNDGFSGDPIERADGETWDSSVEINYTQDLKYISGFKPNR